MSETKSDDVFGIGVPMQVVGYARRDDIDLLLDDNQPEGSYIHIGVDQRNCWVEDTPYNHLTPLYIPLSPGDPVVLNNNTFLLIKELTRNLKILNDRLRSVCKDCADANGICINNGLDCDVQSIIDKSEAYTNF